ncbi:hypothetical protein YN1_1350 [Nanoarchaeota archaeon]
MTKKSKGLKESLNDIIRKNEINKEEIIDIIDSFWNRENIDENTIIDNKFKSSNDEYLRITYIRDIIKSKMMIGTSMSIPNNIGLYIHSNINNLYKLLMSYQFAELILNNNANVFMQKWNIYPPISRIYEIDLSSMRITPLEDPLEYDVEIFFVHFLDNKGRIKNNLKEILGKLSNYIKLDELPKFSNYSNVYNLSILKLKNMDNKTINGRIYIDDPESLEWAAKLSLFYATMDKDLLSTIIRKTNSYSIFEYISLLASSDVKKPKEEINYYYILSANFEGLEKLINNIGGSYNIYNQIEDINKFPKYGLLLCTNYDNKNVLGIVNNIITTNNRIDNIELSIPGGKSINIRGYERNLIKEPIECFK